MKNQAENQAQSYDIFCFRLRNKNTEKALQVLNDGVLDIHFEDELRRNTPLHAAANYGNREVVEALLKAGAKVDATNKFNETPLHCAINSQDMDTIVLLVGAEAAINTPSSFILSKQANPNVKNNRGETPLHLAAQQESLDMTNLLIEAKAAVNETNANGESLLHVLSRKSFETDEQCKIMESLIHHKADVTAKNRHGRTALQYALYYSLTDNLINRGILLFKHSPLDTDRVTFDLALNTRHKDWQLPCERSLMITLKSALAPLSEDEKNLVKLLNILAILFAFQGKVGITKCTAEIIASHAGLLLNLACVNKSTYNKTIRRFTDISHPTLSKRSEERAMTLFATQSKNLINKMIAPQQLDRPAGP